MAAKNIIGSPFKKLWYTWRSHRFPWRKTYFIGMDLQGNTFWEFRDRINASRPRRSVIFKDKSRDWVDYASAVSPAWHQWLRATRLPAPSIEEQRDDDRRREVLARNAAIADERWEKMRSVLEPPQTRVSGEGLQRMQETLEEGRMAWKVGEGVGDGTKEDPWEEAKRGEEEAGKAEWDPDKMLPKAK